MFLIPISFGCWQFPAPRGYSGARFGVLDLIQTLCRSVDENDKHSAGGRSKEAQSLELDKNQTTLENILVSIL